MCKRSTRIGAVALCSLAFLACGYDNGPENQDYQGIDTQSETIPNANIDADATMDNINPGTGVGMFVQYATGGTWTVEFTCDTTITGLNCPWSINAQTLDGSPISGVDVSVVNQPSPGLITYEVTTTTELDRITFQVGAGYPVGFDVWLQGERNPNRYVFWIGDGGLNRGISLPSFNLYPNPAK